MENVEELDFQTTRQVLSRLSTWLNVLGSAVGSPRQVREESRLYYLYEQETPEVVQVAKAARMVSGLNAALDLADDGYVVESAVLLRTVSDFANEIMAIGSDLARNDISPAVKAFCDQYFVAPAYTVDEFLEQERVRYISRAELYKSQRRLAGDEAEADAMLDESRFLDRGYDSYVHGGYRTAMQLWDPNAEQFSVEGTYSAHHECVAKVAVAGKLYYALLALELMARLRGLEEVVNELRESRIQLERSPEYDGTICKE